MKNQENAQRPSQSSRDSSKDAQALTERRRQTLRREGKRAIKGVVRMAENAALKGASEAFRVARKLNKPIRRRIDLSD
jgi:hypothetical protein